MLKISIWWTPSDNTKVYFLDARAAFKLAYRIHRQGAQCVVIHTLGRKIYLDN